MSKLGAATSHLLIGDGRLAQHLRYWFSARLPKNSNPILHWHRRLPEAHLHQALGTGGRPLTIFLAISDSAVEPFWRQHLQGVAEAPAVRVIHFSGAFHHSQIMACHPLASFASELWPLDDYDKVGFVTDIDFHFSETLPFLPNAHVSLPATDRILYHAQCVMGGNFSTLLWSHMQSRLSTLGVPQSFVQMYLTSLMKNFVKLGPAALTGPLVREDWATVSAHQEVLTAPEKAIYQAFVDYWRDGGGGIHMAAGRKL